MSSLNVFKGWGKRCFDLLLASVGIVCLAPSLLLIALWVKLDSPGPVFFHQVRVGRFGRLFRIHKFRTMAVDAERVGLLTINNDPRITHAGRRLRKYKLDELPQLFNVLTGEMSLVGPRPEVPQYLDHYPSWVKEKMLALRPGITDWASLQMIEENALITLQTHSESTYLKDILPQKLSHILRYAENPKLSEDIRIIVATLLALIGRRHDINKTPPKKPLSL